MTTTTRRWLKFNAVGLAGVVVQLTVLSILKMLGGVDYLLASALAVESAVVHNFLWHERWTWVDRTISSPGVLKRLLCFNSANGAISLIGNVVLMWILVEYFHLYFLIANLTAILVCSLINFVVSDKLVFRPSEAN